MAKLRFLLQAIYQVEPLDLSMKKQDRKLSESDSKISSDQPPPLYRDKEEKLLTSERQRQELSLRYAGRFWSENIGVSGSVLSGNEINSPTTEEPSIHYKQGLCETNSISSSVTDCQLSETEADEQEMTQDCPWRFTGTEEDEQRWRATLIGDKILECKICNQSFNYIKQYYQHMVSHSLKYKCHICQKGYKQARAFRAHVLTHKNINRFICDLCDTCLSTPEEYRNHLKEHGRKDLHRCPVCNKYFRDSCTLHSHMLIHKGEKPYKCKVCNKAFRQSGTLNRHTKVHQTQVHQSEHMINML